MTTIGFDVSKAELVGVRVDRRGRSVETYIFENTAPAIVSFLDSLLETHSRLLIASEATAEHHRPLAEICFARGIPFRLLNPITTKQFTRATVRKKKTDLSDALVIAQLALRGEGTPISAHSFSLAQPVSRTAVKLMQMVHMLTLMEQRMHRICPHESEVQQAITLPKERLLESVRTLRLRATAEVDLRTRNLLASIPGIGPTIAAILIAEIGDVSRFPDGKALVAYAGLDPRVRQSGATVKRNTRLTKRGSPYLRRAAYVAAAIGERSDAELKTYFEKKKNEGKRYKEATIAVARKLLYRVYAVWKRGTPYEERPLSTGNA